MPVRLPDIRIEVAEKKAWLNNEYLNNLLSHPKIKLAAITASQEVNYKGFQILGLREKYKSSH